LNNEEFKKGLFRRILHGFLITLLSIF
jgi:septal ring factor EnvC (AmiA/AmiB activator)